MATVDGGSTQRGIDAGIVAELTAEGFEAACIAGQGGFGIVYRCRQPALDRLVAVKVLSQDQDHVDRARFLREQQAMGRLSGHPNIVHVLEAGITYTGRPYIVMSFHPRDSLESWIAQHGPLTVAEALAAGVKLAGALETAHRAGVLHRDIKPANILLSEYGEPQLTDFGIARITGGDDTTQGVVAGSPTYIAPELLSGTDASTATDIYGLGATLFTALAGRPAYARRSGETVFAQLLRIRTEPAPDLRDSGIPDAVSSVIESAMARDPTERPSTAAELGTALRAAGEKIGVAVGELPLPLASEAERPFRALDEVPGSGRAEYLRSPGEYSLRHDSPLPPRASTKYRPPVTMGGMVARTRLLERLGRGGRPRLVLIHAPAGFGKSTLAAQRLEALRSEGVATAWLSIDDDDNTPIWFLTHLVEAIAMAHPALGHALVRELEAYGSGLERYVLTSLIDRLHAADQHVAIVVDDWHRVTNRDTRSALRFLLEHGCHHLHLIVTSRTRLGLPLSTLRVHNELLEIDSAAMRFDVQESAQLLVERSGLDLKEPDLVELEQSTDGWAAALQLVSLALRDHPDPRELISHLSGGHRAIGEYLAENVLESLDPPTLDFLLATAITEKTCGALARALTDDQQAQDMLEDAEARGLFLRRLDEEGQWFRYHPLFAEFLRRRLHRNDPGRTVELHRRAAGWFAEHHYVSQAIDHYLLAGDEHEAVLLVEAAAMDLLEESQFGTLLGFAAKLGDRWSFSARLQTAFGWAHALLGHPHEADDCLTIAEAALGTGDVTGPAADLRGEIALIRATINVFDDRTDGLGEAVERCVARASTLRPWVLCGVADVASFHSVYRFDFDEARRWQQWARPFRERSGGPFGIVYGPCMAGIAAHEQLGIAAAEASFQQAMDLSAEAEGGISGGQLGAALLGDLRYEQGRLAEADRLLDQSHTPGVERGTVDLMLATYGTGARLKVLLDQPESATSRLDEGDRLAKRLGLPRLAARIANERIQAGIGADTGSGATDHRYARRLPASRHGIATIAAEIKEESMIRFILKQSSGRATACERAQALVESIDSVGRPRAHLYAALLHVESLAATGREDDAVKRLLPLAEQCFRLGLARPILDAGPAAISLLERLREQPLEGTENASPGLMDYLAGLEQSI